MIERTYTISVDIEYSVRSAVTTEALAEECRRCDRAIRAFLKERGVTGGKVVVTYAQAHDPS
jgi:glucokinase